MIEQGKLLIGFRDHVSTKSRDMIHQQFGVKCIKKFPQLNVEVVEVPKGEEEKYRQMYMALADVTFVDFNCLRKPNCKPNDPYYEEPLNTTNDGLQSQWGLRRIKPERAFDKAKCIKLRSKIAILDTGIDPNHPDLAKKIIDPINFGSDNPNDYIDREGHGTHVAGIAAAITNNKIGIASASYNTAAIIPIKLGDREFTSEALIEGILYAIEKGADVMNMSLGGPCYNQAEQNAIELAWKNGVIIVAAAGNEGHERPSYPAAYNFVLGVSATDKNNQLAPFSNWGVYVGIAAPGTAILSTTPTYPLPDLRRKYDTMQGTSMATPFVSGVAAMLRAIKPQATNQEIIQAIQQSARNLETDQKKWMPFYGYGLLNASNAVNVLKGKENIDSEALGSFYGQAVDENNQPLEDITIIAFNNKTDKEAREYQTKGDGMFRLFNLPAGNYLIGYAPEGTNVAVSLIDSINIVPGADIFLKLVISDLE
ncbi:S8 family serine peptidase [Neobacillus cucumis]|uniref:S8 family serine peptidase n=1 Tax=Neobacillus cucumis TaxID=1740721 RepID=UPI0018E00E3C|nr:S8 family serine peptidase [Neobacillus cucumis]MBI0577920.1 S8 family serine peptidase [Neobacillus cucumis]